MSETRDVFKAGVSASIYTNTQKLIKGDTVRDKFLVLADSVPFLNQANMPGGYLGIHSTNGNVNVTFIKSTSPSGKFLRDDGSWADPSCVCVPAGSDHSIQFNYYGNFEGSSRFLWEEDDHYLKVDGTSVFGLFDIALSHGATPADLNPTAVVDIISAEDYCASLRIRPGYSASSRPGAPNEGDIWNDGSSLWIYMGGIERRFNLM
jgi:hypothetical protein